MICVLTLYLVIFLNFITFNILMDSLRIHTRTQCSWVKAIPRSSLTPPDSLPISHLLPTSCPVFFFVNSPPDSICAVHMLMRAGPGTGEQSVYQGTHPQEKIITPLPKAINCQ